MDWEFQKIYLKVIIVILWELVELEIVFEIRITIYFAFFLQIDGFKK